MSLHEALSRLLAGDLPDDEAEALRRRIEAEPEVARAWAAMVAMPGELAALPEEAPPPELDARVLGRATPIRRRWPVWVVPVALAATAVLWLGLRPAPERIAILSGDQVVQGDVEVVAGDVVVAVDGLARISVEPDATLVRATAAEEEPMKLALSALAGAAGGAAVTVAVLEGTATVEDAAGETVALKAGDRHTTRVPARAVPLPAPPEGETSEEKVARLEAEVAALSEQLSRAEFTGAVAQGQLTAHVGTPQPWPADVPEGLAPDAFEQRVREVVAAHEGVELVELDCSEYPCITVLRPVELVDGWQDTVRPAAEALTEGLDDMGRMVSASFFNDDGKTAALMGVTVAPVEDLSRDSEVGARASYRADVLLDELGRK